ncbi:MAG: Hsp20/alpha crystallin family protein [Bacteroidaceae bacterium]|nr:Hsp20/alpha crystallin family protein [Bacteroidaceae bacterium]MBQ8542285.1 Hsp20/alpha crystallin family protein [Bacteroidaceae bacterium]
MPMKRGAQQWLPSIFNDFFNSDIMTRSGSTAPAINVFETEKEYLIDVAAPGMKKDDFCISLNADNDLCITMEKGCNCKKNGEDCKCDEKKEDEKCKDDKCCEHNEAKGRFLRREFSYTKFRQTLILPDDADTASIKAKVHHGVLRIDIPKKAPSKVQEMSKEINIE